MDESMNYTLALSSIGRSLHADGSLPHAPASARAITAQRQHEQGGASSESSNEAIAGVFDDFDYERLEDGAPCSAAAEQQAQRSTAGCPHRLATIPEQQATSDGARSGQRHTRHAQPRQVPELQSWRPACSETHIRASPPAAPAFAHVPCPDAGTQHSQQQQPHVAWPETPAPLPATARPPARHRHRRQNAILSGDGAFDFPDWELDLRSMQPV